MKYAIAIATVLVCIGCVNKKEYVSRAELRQELISQLELYSDLCAEANSDFIDEDATLTRDKADSAVSDAHFNGVRCAVESLNMHFELGLEGVLNENR